MMIGLSLLQRWRAGWGAPGRIRVNVGVHSCGLAVHCSEFFWLVECTGWGFSLSPSLLVFLLLPPLIERDSSTVPCENGFKGNQNVSLTFSSFCAVYLPELHASPWILLISLFPFLPSRHFYLPCSVLPISPRHLFSLLLFWSHALTFSFFTLFLDVIIWCFNFSYLHFLHSFFLSFFPSF